MYTVQIERRDWFKVGRSLLSRSYWSGTCTVDPGYRCAPPADHCRLTATHGEQQGSSKHSRLLASPGRVKRAILYDVRTSKAGKSCQLTSMWRWHNEMVLNPPHAAVVRWYLERVQQAVDRARSECKQDQVNTPQDNCLRATSQCCSKHVTCPHHLSDCRGNYCKMLGQKICCGWQVHLVGHSAGGWLGRSFIADPLYFDSPAAEPGVPHQGVASLVTLGTPHSAPLPDQARDMTGGALTWVNSQWPGKSVLLLEIFLRIYKCSSEDTHFLRSWIQMWPAFVVCGLSSSVCPEQ